MLDQQLEIRFWHDTPPSVEQRKWWISPKNPRCALSQFIGNEKAMKRLRRAAFVATGRHNHCCSEYAFALCGPASTGKTTLARLFAETLKLPFVEIQPQQVSRVHDIFERIQKVCQETVIYSDEDEEYSLELFNYADEGDKVQRYTLPPMIVFIDEVHELRNSVEQGLLKATERNDGQLATERGVEADATRVCWFIATTDRGELTSQFDTRFRKILLRLYSRKEVAQIIQLKNPDWDFSICELVAKYSNIPREAADFAVDMRAEHEMNGGDWAEIAARVATEYGIDQFGMTHQRLEILTALGQRPIAANQLILVAQTKEADLKKFIMPPLLAVTPDQTMPLVTTTSRGYTITPAGLEELERRSIPNLGLQAMPEQARTLFENMMRNTFHYPTSEKPKRN
jgi:Holliday junction resolvasome RuvABC ATP-dependent DNA helicase subunit